MRVALCCESAGPVELIHDALAIGKTLMRRGHDVAFVTGDPVSLVGYAGGWLPTELHQAPMLRTPPHLVMKRPAPDGMADTMALQGFDDKEALLTLSAIWNRQFATLRADAILGFYTTLAWLVGPAHAPTFALGHGHTLPPAMDMSFPRLRVQSVPLTDEDTLLDNANAALARLGHASMASLSDLIGRCAAILYGVPALDPYLPFRREHSAGLLGDRPGPALPPVMPHLAAILDIHCPGIETVALALAGDGQATIDICLNGVPAGMRRFLEHQPHIRLWDDQAALLDRAATASVLMHHGVHNVAQRALVLGRPQLLVPWTTEHHLLRHSLTDLGCMWEKPPSVSIDEMAGTLRAMMRDNSLMVAAQHHARQLAALDLPDALPMIVGRIEAAAPAAVSFRRDKVVLL